MTGGAEPVNRENASCRNCDPRGRGGWQKLRSSLAPSDEFLGNSRV
jgi:hypothetical protein